MEWLQTYNIGNSLIKSGKYNWQNAYHSSYYPPYIKDTRDRKTPYILEIIIDFPLEEVRLDSRQLDGSDLELHDSGNPFVKEGYFTSVAGNFTSYYLCTPYKKGSSILDFFGIKDGKIKLPKKKNDLIGYEKDFTQLIKCKLLSENFKNSKLVQTRDLVRGNKPIIKGLNTVITNLKLFVEVSQKKAFDKQFAETEYRNTPLNSRLNTSPKGNADIAFIVVKIVKEKDGQGFYLNREQEAIEFYSKRFLNLAGIDSKRQKKGVCYFTEESDVYNVSLPRDNVNLLKISTNLTTTDSNFQGSTFSVSRAAYDRLKLGSWFLAKKMTTKIANIPHYILPDFTNDFNILQYKAELTDKVDLVFKEAEYDRMKRRLFRLSNENINSISFIGFIGDDRQIDFVNRIQIVEPDYFNYLFETFQQTQEEIAELADGKWNELSRFSLSSSYRLFPISTSEPKKNPVLLFFKMLFEKTPIPLSFLMDNYQKLLKVYRYGKENEKKKVGKKSSYGGILNVPYESKEYADYAISVATLKYLILINFISRINKTHNMENNTNEIDKTEQFFETAGFSSSESKKALFYLGRLTRRIADAQSSQGNSKAILEKINYSGMRVEDIQWLSCEVFEKLKQYNRGKSMTLKYGKDDWKFFSESFLKANAKGQNSWGLSEMENVFYILTGYGMYWQTKEEHPNSSEQNSQVTEEIGLKPES